MAKLVVLTQSMAGRSCDLASERTTIGRVEENNFQISEPSVSSRHCEILLRGNDVVVKDLGSTNGTFINGEKITEEGVLKPGQTLRLGNIELKLDTLGASGAPAPASGSAPAPAPPAAPAPKKEPTKAAAGGVRMSDLEGGRTVAIDTSVFTKKKKSTNLYFWIGAAVASVIIIIMILVLISKVHSS
ncbi:MAG TPA: FHA domain-containing protein [Candidatus Acidoferrum sp.]|jgi:predicted component of type VI protein secretion system|nr:FHA domain-containing protein [Candidatus Acidoferrum sp.]